jgi:predicted MFS family arabinose efflux permease
MGLTGSIVTLVLPTVLAETLPGSNLVDRLVAMEMLGAAVATTCLPPFLGNINRRLLAIIACIATMSLDIVSLRSGSGIPLQWVRCAAGFTEGTVLAVSVACVASSKAPERNLALFVAINLSTATIILKLLRATVAVAGHHGPFSLLVALAVMSTLAAAAIPGRGRAPIDQPLAMSPADTRSGASPWAVAIGLVAFVALAAGAGSVWPSMIKFASAIDIPVAAVTRILGDATLAGIAGALLAAWLGTRCTRQTIVTLGTVAMLGSVIALDNVSHRGFTWGAMIFMASWMFLVPSYMGILAAADHAGRAAAFSLATQYGGLALGASLANLLLRSDGAHAILLASGLLFGAALVMVIYADRIVGSGRVPMSELV